MGNRALAVFAIIICLSASVPAMAVERNVEKSFNVKRGGTLILNSDTGTVDIKSHAQNTVLINVELIAHTSSDSRAKDIYDNFKLDFNNDNKGVTITGNLGSSWSWPNKRLTVHFNITVPNQYNLAVKTGGGYINVSDIKGQATLKTSGGSIKLGNIDGELDARTSGGSIKVEDVAGNTFVKTSGGSIRIGRVKGNLEARTSGGGIDVDGVDGNLIAHTSGGGLHLMNISGSLIGDTSGGPIVAELTGQVKDRVELRTSGGGIRLSVPADFKADLNASTSGGRVYTDIPVTVHGHISNTSIHGKMNGGGPEVSLRTSGGGIRITHNTD